MGKALAKTSDKEILAKAEDIQAKSIQSQAEKLVPEAIDTLGKLMKGKSVGAAKPNATVVRSAARDIIEFAGGRPETRDPHAGDAGALQIVIQQFGPEVAQRILVTNDIPGVKRMEKPREINPSVSEEFEVPDAQDHDPV